MLITTDFLHFKSPSTPWPLISGKCWAILGRSDFKKNMMEIWMGTQIFDVHLSNAFIFSWSKVKKTNISWLNLCSSRLNFYEIHPQRPVASCLFSHPPWFTPCRGTRVVDRDRWSLSRELLGISLARQFLEINGSWSGEVKMEIMVSFIKMENVKTWMKHDETILDKCTRFQVFAHVDDTEKKGMSIHEFQNNKWQASKTTNWVPKSKVIDKSWCFMNKLKLWQITCRKTPMT